MRVSIHTPPTAFFIATSDAKQYLGIDFAEDDAIIETCLKSAAAITAQMANASMMTQTLDLTIGASEFDEIIQLPYAPVTAVESVTGVDEEWVALPMVMYVVRDNRVRVRNKERRGEYTVRYTAGHASTDAVPAPLVQAALLLAGHYYVHREAILASGAVPKSFPLGFDSIMHNWRNNQYFF